jgi:hypothetical protein
VPGLPSLNVCALRSKGNAKDRHAIRIEHPVLRLWIGREDALEGSAARTIEDNVSPPCPAKVQGDATTEQKSQSGEHSHGREA